MAFAIIRCGSSPTRRNAVLTLPMAAYNLARLRSPAVLRPQAA